MLLGDAAQVDPTGKTHVLGLGWTRTSVPTNPMAIVILLAFDAMEEASSPHTVRVTLVDSKDEVVDLPTAGRAMEFTADLQPNAGTGVELPVTVSVVIQLPSLPLEPDTIYVWRASVDDASDAAWVAPFSTYMPSASVS